MSIDARFVEEFKRRVDQAAVELRGIDDAAAGRSRAAGRWTRKEILGHLIDSAANNHARFVRAQSTDHLRFDGYDQDAWVSVQRYNDIAWTSLVTLWHAYNLHLAHVMAVADPAVVARPRTQHALDRIAFRPVDAATPATLGHFMADYVAHLEHHLRQILES